MNGQEIFATSMLWKVNRCFIWRVGGTHLYHKGKPVAYFVEFLLGRRGEGGGVIVFFLKAHSFPLITHKHFDVYLF